MADRTREIGPVHDSVLQVAPISIYLSAEGGGGEVGGAEGGAGSGDTRRSRTDPALRRGAADRRLCRI